MIDEVRVTVRSARCSTAAKPAAVFTAPMSRCRSDSLSRSDRGVDNHFGRHAGQKQPLTIVLAIIDFGLDQVLCADPAQQG